MILPILILFLISPYVISNYMAFFFLIPCLYLIYSSESFNHRLFLATVIIFAMIALLPVVLYNPFIYLLGSAIIAVFLFAFFAISRIIVKRLNGAISIFVPCVVWALLLYMFNFKSVLASMFDIGVLAPMSAPMIWYTGSIGLTILIVLFNSAAARFFAKRDRLSLILTILIAASFAGSFIFSAVKDPGYLSAAKKPVKVALIQGAIPSRTLFGYKDNVDKRIKRYVDLSSKVDSAVDIVVWPEYAFPTDVIARFPDKAKPVFDQIKRSDKTFVIGSIRDDPVKKGVHYDSALVIGPDGNIAQTYYSPKPFVFSKNITAGQFDGKLYIDSAGIVICWEEFGAKIFRDYVNSGAEYFIALLSDVDLDHSWLKRYVTFFSRARAAENMRYLARSTQTGVTELISPFGKVIASIPADKAGYLAGDIYKVSSKTFYSVHGDILTRIFLVLMALSMIYIARTKRAGEHE
jgi:apolipoprotein N-acyltransferase